jgi:hypothetical protein
MGKKKKKKWRRRGEKKEVPGAEAVAALHDGHRAVQDSQAHLQPLSNFTTIRHCPYLIVYGYFPQFSI